MKLSFKPIAYAVAAVALLISTNTFAQTDSKAWRLGIGFNAGIATDDPYGFVPGGDLRLQKDFTSNVSAILTTGYTCFVIKDKYDGPGKQSYDFIPLKAGVKVFPVQRFYVVGELGAGFGLPENSKTGFLYAPGIGVAFNNGLDLGLRYEGLAIKNDVTNNTDNVGQVALRIAYGFNLSK
ncbi:porin family protein [Pedobacter sp. BS3]|uniref:outer membrane beta-barrel protein n=1 Tax=Pedobacter sp. BS3 TaxID=2567937 RepID=UPI0011ED3D16|nr:outer membrane beta-barrel protein [Pedobacter sp. BS3]TZF84867.1 porin family protein [Pedobacter sp. BS3]